MKATQQAAALKLWQVAEVKLSYINTVKMAERPVVASSADAASVFFNHWSDDMELLESFNVLFLDRANRVKGFYPLSKGGMTGTVVDPRLIFAAALKALACGLILAHNHPSGQLRPSQPDIDVTRKLKAAGQVLEIPVLDHLILTTQGYFSFADEGLL